VSAASQYPFLPTRAERELMTLEELYEVYHRMLRGEYSIRPEEVERLREDGERAQAMILAGMSPVDIYATFCQETGEEVEATFGPD
jgi:hypothetical protein